MATVTPAQMKESIGTEHVSDWVEVTQAMIDRFAEATGDDQFIHVDPVRAAETPFGGTIAHGFLTLSLMPMLSARTDLPRLEGARMGVNYGGNSVRFLSPVRSGARVRGRFRLIGLTERAVSVQSAWDAAIEIENAPKPALSAHWITLAVIEPPAA